MLKRYILTDRAGNQIAGAPVQATQAGAIYVSRRHAPCWIIEEKAKPDYTGWLYSRDVGHRNDQLDYIPMPLANQGE